MSLQWIRSLLALQFDEKSWYTVFGMLTFGVFIIGYLLGRYTTVKVADDQPISRRKRLEKHGKIH
jgi:hypothetical protein